MGAATNVSATRHTLRTLRRTERLTEAHATLALTTARALDDVVASDEKRYVVAQLSRAHLLALDALLSVPEPAAADGFDQLLAEIMRPGPGALELTSDGRL